MTAVRKMNRYSLIQFAEQIAKIFITVLIVGKTHFIRTELAIALVCAAITASEVISFSLAMFAYLADIKKEVPTKAGKKGFSKRMLRLAVPDAVGSYIRSSLNTIEHLLIPRGIKKSGLSVDKAFSDYGIIQGMALPVILYPSSILGVISGLLVPEIAECVIRKNEVQKNYMINRVLNTAMIFSMITASVMIVFSRELSLAIYKTDEAALFILQIAPLIPIMYLDMTTDGMLKGLDKQLDIMKINIIDSVLCVILVALLVPKIAVAGYVITIYVAEIINFLLSFYKLIRSARIRFTFLKNFLKPLCSSFLACILAKKLLLVFSIRLHVSVFILISVIFYLAILFIIGGITKEEVNWFSHLFYRKKMKEH
jgi:stage V sporulation protein B